MVLISDDRSLSLWTRLVEWFQGPLGHSVLQAERAQLGPVLSGLFGFHIVQIGALGAADLLAGSRIAHRIVLNIDPQLPIQCSAIRCARQGRYRCKPAVSM